MFLEIKVKLECRRGENTFILLKFLKTQIYPYFQIKNYYYYFFLKKR